MLPFIRPCWVALVKGDEQTVITPQRCVSFAESCGEVNRHWRYQGAGLWRYQWAGLWLCQGAACCGFSRMVTCLNLLLLLLSRNETLITYSGKIHVQYKRMRETKRRKNKTHELLIVMFSSIWKKLGSFLGPNIVYRSDQIYKTMFDLLIVHVDCCRLHWFDIHNLLSESKLFTPSRRNIYTVKILRLIIHICLAREALLYMHVQFVASTKWCEFAKLWSRHVNLSWVLIKDKYIS